MLPKLTKDFYGNIEFLSPSGEFMFYNSEKRANWYLSRGLAKEISSTCVQFLIEPKGVGNSGHKYHSEKRENKCVVCGSCENLTRHHIVPYMFRSYFPRVYKDNASYDVMMMCYECHEKYEVYATLYKREIFEKGGLLKKKDRSNKSRYDCHPILKALWVIGTVFDKLPEAKKNEFSEICKYYFGEVLSPQECLEIHSIISEKHAKKTSVQNKKIVEDFVSKIDNIHEFIVLWRKHFLEYAKPKFLSENWSVEKDHKGYDTTHE